MKLKPTKLNRAAITVKPSEIHGYGVFAEKRILKSEIIEECPVILFRPGTYSTATMNFVFEWKEKDTCALALGYGSLYNHANKPNADYYIDLENDLITFKATQAIYKGEEILVNYRENWFKDRGITIKKPKQKKINKYRVLNLIILILLLLALSFGVFLLRN